MFAFNLLLAFVYLNYLMRIFIINTRFNLLLPSLEGPLVHQAKILLKVSA